MIDEPFELLTLENCPEINFEIHDDPKNGGLPYLVDLQDYCNETTGRMVSSNDFSCLTIPKHDNTLKVI